MVGELQHKTGEMRHSEDELFSRFKRSGDADALGEVVDLVGPELLRVALHLTGRPAEAEDLLQETLLVAMERAERWDSSRPLRPWLVGILTNRARLARQRAGRTPDPDRLEREVPRRPCDRAVELELTEDVETAIGKVPAAYRSVLVLRLKHHLAVAEIAEALDRPPGTVRSQLQRGLEHLRRLLPASYAGALLVVLGRPARGLPAIREALVAQAGAATVTGAAASSITGILAMKHLVAAAAIALCTAAGVTLFRSDRASGQSLTPISKDVALERPEELLAPQATNDREEVAIAPAVTKIKMETDAKDAAPIGYGSLLIRARHEESNLPASGYRAMVQAFGQPEIFYDPAVHLTDENGETRASDLPAGPVYVRLLRGTQGSVEICAGDDGGDRTEGLGGHHGRCVGCR